MSNNVLAVILTLAIVGGMIVYYEIKARVLKALENSPRKRALAQRKRLEIAVAIMQFRQHYRQIIAAQTDLDRGLSIGATVGMYLSQSRYAFRRALRQVRVEDVEEARYWIKRAESRLALAASPEAEAIES